MSYIVKYEDIGIVDYKKVWDYQASVFNKLVAAKTNKGNDPENLPGTLIFVEHPHVYTLGKSGSENNLLIDQLQIRAKDASFYRIDRGGDITYHGPGQLVGYPIFDLDKIGIGLKEYIYKIEEAIIRSIAAFGLNGSRLEGGIGVWLDPEIKGRARKICAIGVKSSRFVTMHGFALNVNTDLSWFNLINPCGFTDKGVTSIEAETGGRQEMEKVKQIVKKELEKSFELTWKNI